MEIIKPRTLSGFMELLPEKQLKFDRMAEVPVSYTHLTLPTMSCV